MTSGPEGSPQPDDKLREGTSLSSELIFEVLRKRMTFAKSTPDRGFDPLTASAEELERFKLPPRPDPRQNPRAFANWRRAMSPPLRFVSPENLEILLKDPTALFRVAEDRRHHQFESAADSSQEVSRNWSGAYVRDNPGERYVSLQGTWVVPRPYPPPPAVSGDPWPEGTFYSSCWVGLDGHDPASLSLPQMGIGNSVSVPDAVTTDPNNLTVSVNAWWQWWVKGDSGNHPIEILPSIFPVHPGDIIIVQLNVLNSTTVRFVLKNQSTGQVFPPFDVTVPVLTNLNRAVAVEGRTAEWIIERPTKVASIDLRPFCDYGAVTFYGCNAQVQTTPGGSVTEDRQLQRARLIRLADWTQPGGTPFQPGMQQPGIVVSSAAPEGDDSVLVYYRGNGP